MKTNGSLPICTSSPPDHDAFVTIHPSKSESGILVTVQPPTEPLDFAASHVPCDIVLVIDVSVSMDDQAPAAVHDDQGNATKEDFGLTVLDLTKHAARTILSTLNENDRLGIVTFSAHATVVQQLTPMTPAHKKMADANIGNMKTVGSTNLWDGIRNGIELFRSGEADGRVPALMVLTDGQPNIGDPAQGYVKKLRSLAPLPAIINTFGFGYNIRAGLLKSIVEVGNGNYAFIPDAGMIGTVFVHAVAQLQSTYATECVLEISAPDGVLLKSTTGKSIDHPQEETGSGTITVQLGNLQYGQSRDIYLEAVDQTGHRTTFELLGENSIMSATLTYSRMSSPRYAAFTHQDILGMPPLPDAVMAYHQSRSMICQLLSSGLSVSGFGYTEKTHKDFEVFNNSLQYVMNNIPARDFKDEYNRSLMADLNGQISEALSKRSYFDRWGRRYFFSLWNAHAKQLCNSFKDTGPLMYNNNPLFARYRDALSEAFDSIPPPTPSTRQSGGNPAAPVSMTRYNSRRWPCFAASSPVLLVTGDEVPAGTLQEGMAVQTPMGPRRVRAVVKTEVYGAPMCCVGNLAVTPWHPVQIEQSEGGRGAWAFPTDVAERTIEYSGTICSVLLERDGDADAHAIRVGGVWAVTLGHGVLSGSDIRAHRFLGDYNAVAEELIMLGPGESGVHWSAGVRREADSGKVCGFERLPSASMCVVEGRDLARPDGTLPEIQV
ncbi:putative u-box domain-containing protein [Rosellinia necatrix]|uniref:Putative u-box domain-containing protein n=1 Tax=Rosellinia necatrix TaxID=77044 RepID=A0A1W2TX69_ROSNE|nr:putative u-box domain-containing protein [Rosellinia necatrix]